MKSQRATAITTLGTMARQINLAVWKDGANKALDPDLSSALDRAFLEETFAGLTDPQLAFLCQEMHLEDRFSQEFIALAPEGLGAASATSEPTPTSPDHTALASGEGQALPGVLTQEERSALLTATKQGAPWLYSHVYQGGQAQDLPPGLRTALDLAFPKVEVRGMTLPGEPDFTPLSDAQLHLVVEALQAGLAKGSTPQEPKPEPAPSDGPRALSRKAERITFDSLLEGLPAGNIRRNVLVYTHERLLKAAWGVLEHGKATRSLSAKEAKAYTEEKWKALSPYLQHRAYQNVMEDATSPRPSNSYTQALGRTIQRMRDAHEAVDRMAESGHLHAERRNLQATRYGVILAIAGLEGYQYGISAANVNKSPKELAQWGHTLLVQATKAVENSTYPQKSKDTSLQDIASLQQGLSAAEAAGDRRGVQAINQLLTIQRIARKIYDADSRAQSFGGALKIIGAPTPANIGPRLAAMFDRGLAQLHQRPPLDLAPLFTRPRDERSDVGAFAYNVAQTGGPKLDANGLEALKADLDKVREPIVYTDRLQEALAAPTETGYCLAYENQQKAFLANVILARRYKDLENTDLTPDLAARIQRGLNALSFTDQQEMLHRLVVERLVTKSTT